MGFRVTLWFSNTATPPLWLFSVESSYSSHTEAIYALTTGVNEDLSHSGKQASIEFVKPLSH